MEVCECGYYNRDSYHTGIGGGGCNYYGIRKLKLNIAELEQQLGRMTAERDDWEGRYNALYTNGPLHTARQQLAELREAIRKEIDGYRQEGWFNADKMAALLKQGGEG